MLLLFYCPPFSQQAIRASKNTNQNRKKNTKSNKLTLELSQKKSSLAFCKIKPIIVRKP